MNEKQELKKTQQLEEKRQQQQASGGHPPPAVPPEVKALFDKLTRIEDEIDRASDTQILKGKGTIPPPQTKIGCCSSLFALRSSLFS